MLGVGTRELILIIVIFFLFFGTKKIPELARVIRDTIKIIRRTFAEEADRVEKEEKEDQAVKIDKKMNEINKVNQ